MVPSNGFLSKPALKGLSKLTASGIHIGIVEKITAGCFPIDTPFKYFVDIFKREKKLLNIKIKLGFARIA